MDWVVSLPMYNVTQGLDARWKALLNRAVALLKADGFTDSVTVLDDPGERLTDLWQRPELLLSQTCGYPLMTTLPPSLQLVGAPVFDVAGCDGASYQSVIVVSAAAYRDGARALSSCRGLRAAHNSADSHSGYNTFRDAIAPLADGHAYFASVIETGSHFASLQALADERADIAAIDCVTLAFVEDAFPSLVGKWHRIGTTASAPSLPFIASAHVDAALMRALRSALARAISEDVAAGGALGLRHIAPISREAYQAILAAQNRAVTAGYPLLV